MSWHPTAIVRLYTSDMILQVHSYTSYLTAPKTQSRTGGNFFLGSIPVDGKYIISNGHIHSLSAILKHVASSAAETELGALFLNARDAIIMGLILYELGHPQPATPIHCENTAVIGIVNNTIKRQRSRAMEMRYVWLLDGEAQNMFKFHYHPGQENLGDYHIRAFLGKYLQREELFYDHNNLSPCYLVRSFMPSNWRGSV